MWTEGQTNMNWKAIMLSFEIQWVLSLTWRCRIESQILVCVPNWDVDVFYGTQREWFCQPHLDTGWVHIIRTSSFSWNIEVETLPMHSALPTPSSVLEFSVAPSFQENACFPFSHGQTSVCFFHLIYEAGSRACNLWSRQCWVFTLCFWDSYGHHMLWALNWVGRLAIYCSALLCVTQGV